MGLLTKDGDIGYYPLSDKHVCSDCFGDECIKGFIESQAESLKCDFCGKESSEPIAADINEVIEYILDCMSTEWENPYEWANGLPEYPRPFWTYFFGILGDWVKLAVFSLFSPADIHIYDAQGRHVGIDEEGKLQNQIPGAIYITPEGTDYKIVLIPDADVSNEYVIVVNGTSSGTMDIKAQVPDAESKLKRFLEYTDVPVSPTLTARTAIKPEVPALMRLPSPVEIRGGTTRDTTTKLEIDSDGDGVFELQSPPGTFKKQEVQPTKKAGFTGFITEIHQIGKEGTLGQVLVESHADKLVDKYIVTMTNETLIFKQDGENRHQVTFETLETRQRVQIWFTGLITESFPMQGTAQQVVITE